MGRLWLPDSIHLQSLAWNLRLACRAGRYGNRSDCSAGAGRSTAAAWLCGEQKLRGLESFRHFGSYGRCEYRSAGPTVRSKSLRDCFDRPYDAAPAGADSYIPSPDVPDAASDCVVSGATTRQITVASAQESTCCC